MDKHIPTRASNHARLVYKQTRGNRKYVGCVDYLKMLLSLIKIIEDLKQWILFS